MPPSTTRLKTLSKRKAEFIEPMDCAPVSKLPDGSQWLFEIKLDGYRAIAVKVDGRVNLFSRRHKSFNHQYLHIAEALSDLPDGTVVDGEVVALDESGRPNFNLLQNFRSEASRIHYFIFDLLVCQDRDLTRLPLTQRRKLMKSVLKLRSPHLRIAEQFETSASDMIAAVRQQQLEGVIGKRKDSLYEAGKRTGSWIKYRVNRGQELVVSSYVHDALVVFAGGGISVPQIRTGSRHVSELQREMDRARRERLQSLGFEPVVATAMSAYHTKNFM